MSVLIAPTEPIQLSPVGPPSENDFDFIPGYELRQQDNGAWQYFFEDIPLYVVKRDDPPRYNPNLKCPPMVQAAFDRPSWTAGTVFTRMGGTRGPDWTPYLKKLNGDKWEDAVGPHLAMYNRVIPEGDEWSWPAYDRQESLWFGLGSVVGAHESAQRPYFWAELTVPDFYAGPYPGMPTYFESPYHAMRFTAICREGGVILHANDFFYPSTCDTTVFMRWALLEPFGPDSALIVRV